VFFFYFSVKIGSIMILRKQLHNSGDEL